LVQRKDDVVVLKYVTDRPGRVGEVTFETGSTTYARYKTGDGHVLWKMKNPQGNLEGHLFHICRDLLVGKDRVEYLDLLLDIWVDTEGRVTVLDQDEVDACAAAGTIGREDVSLIEGQARFVLENVDSIIAGFEV
jgi:predicted RNA-binding protein associated with RNAse of E/G family